MKNILKKTIPVCLVTLLSVSAFADINKHSPRLKSVFEWEIGGGYVGQAPTKVHTVPILEFGIGWDLNMSCGKFDPKISVSNQLNGVTDGFKNMMDNIISAAKGYVANLPALALQRASPELYDMLQQGILQGKMDFEWAETSCEEMTRVMQGEESFPFEKYKMTAQFNDWKGEVNASGGDAIKAKDGLANYPENNGIEWICGATRGGSNQQPIRALSDVVLVGYNIMFDRVNSCSTATVSAADGQGTALWSYWNGPQAAAAWAKKVIGESEIRICDGCPKITGTPGKGLTYMHREMVDDLEEDIEDLVNGSVLLSFQNMNRVSAPPGVIVEAPLIHAIRKRNTESQKAMIEKLAGEIAYTRIVEQGRLLTQLLRSGIKEPNTANVDVARAVVNDAIDSLNVELDQLDKEMKVRKTVAKETIHRIMGLEEKAIQQATSGDRGSRKGTTIVGQPK